ncbi:hypothetical protein PX699_06825 [Sphingobium sp. H39-3-25]|uniref:hypothetical protein n=1 Tax=Sphingobium arseniciresistens TaxID=3030834 RepID=UPI0023B90AE1|nr:hypothetical protein [Sphingobium arseniciresistens]
MMMTIRRNPHSRLLRILLIAAGPDAAIARASTEPWASITFQGARHLISLRFFGPESHRAANAMADRLPKQDFAIPGHIVADVAVDERLLDHEPDGTPSATLELSILTIEDW